MKCLRPIKKCGDLLPCGKCEACLANKTNEYIIRFNATQNEMCAYFCTLTYSDDYIPKNGVYKGDCQLFLRNLKATLDKQGIIFKYVLISEYGGRRCRPHYHLNLFTSALIPLLPTLENCWKYGIVHGKLVDDKQLHYVAKYHSTQILSKNIRKFVDYPIFFRVDDDKTYEECEKQFMERFSISPTMWSRFPTMPCTPPFRLSSHGIGEELLSSDNFQTNIRNNHFYILNNYEKQSSLPRYYVDKLPLSAQINRRVSQFEYARTRQSNKIDDLAIQLNNLQRSTDYYQKEWAKHYEENVLLRKKHNQANID